MLFKSMYEKVKIFHLANSYATTGIVSKWYAVFDNLEICCDTMLPTSAENISLLTSRSIMPIRSMAAASLLFFCL